MNRMKAILTATAVVAISFGLLAMSSLKGNHDDALPEIVSSTGDIGQPPEDFRRLWSHLGTWAVLDEDSGAHGIHDVYSQSSSIEAYRKTGTFPDGAVLIKEIRGFKTDDLTTGHVAYAGDPAVWFVMVKDSTARFEGKNPLWAEGWGWAMYQSSEPGKQMAESFEASCQGCHTPVEDTDWVFVDGYPTLQSSK